jgi:predicted lysophospholipase L1 biosynthesis ABC-type transport system permease subunit
VETGSLYPALHRLERQGWVRSEWKQTESNQRAKYYRVTATGKKQLASDHGRWQRMVEAIGAIMNGALAVVLAMIGLYGVMSYTVAERTSEIGIRMALGAQRTDVTAMILRKASALLVAGLALGAGLSLACASAASALLFGLKPSDPGDSSCGFSGGRTGGKLSASPASRCSGPDSLSQGGITPSRLPLIAR